MKQRGISLIVVLVALLIIGFAAVALLRSSDTGTLVVGNLAFKKTALGASDAGTETALAWLVANAAGVDASTPTTSRRTATIPRRRTAATSPARARRATTTTTSTGPASTRAATAT